MCGMIRKVGATRIPGFDAAAMRAAREAMGWSQGRLGVEVGMAVVTISSWERSKSAPEPPKFVQLARALNVEPAALLRAPRAEWTLTDLRVVTGTHQREAAHSLGIQPTRLSHIEAGYEALRSPLTEKLAQLYGVTSDQIQHAWQRGRDQLLA